MGSNTFGKIFQMTTWGESHGKAIGVVIDGCPAGLQLHESDIQHELAMRAPGRAHTSPRKEPDNAEILSGVFEGKTTGAPISIMIRNRDIDSGPYETTKELLKPGHANYTYLHKYGIYDHRGGGRSSARETACRVAAGAIAKKFIALSGISVCAYLQQIGPIEAAIKQDNIQELIAATKGSPIFCPDKSAESEMIALLKQMSSELDSIGGGVGFTINGLPPGLGEPTYDKLEAMLANAMMSIHATKGFEIGSGFRSIAMKGSEHNDLFVFDASGIKTASNNAGGTLGGISTGMPITGRVAFKPASSIGKKQQTVTIKGEKAVFHLPKGSRHDPCVAIRAVAVVEAMAALIIADALLMNSNAKATAFIPEESTGGVCKP